MSAQIRTQVVVDNTNATRHIRISTDGLLWFTAEMVGNHAPDSEVIMSARSLHKRLAKTNEPYDCTVLWDSVESEAAAVVSGNKEAHA